MPVKVKPDTATVKDGMIFISGEPTGVFRSEHKYTNFVLEYEWGLVEVPCRSCLP